MQEKQGVKGAEEEASKHTIAPKCVRIGYLNSEFIDPCHHKFEDVKYNVSRCVICGKYEQL